MQPARTDGGDGGSRLDTAQIPNREAIAQFLLENRDRVRAFARRKLTARARTVFDSEDVFSSVLRRIDTLASAGELRKISAAELWALVATIAHNNAVSRSRLIERARSRLREDGPYAYELPKRLRVCATDDQAKALLLRMMLHLKSEEDRLLLSLLHRGVGHRAIGLRLGISEEASRQRWARIRRELVDRFADGQIDR